MFVHHIEGPDDYRRLVHKIRCYGEDVAPRGHPTKEVRGATVVLHSPEHALPVGVGRGINVDFAAAEALQLVGEFSDAEWLGRINPNVLQFAEKTEHPMGHPTYEFWGGYGKRVEGQLSFVLRSLQSDQDSRQAQVVLWDPKLDNVAGKKDYPCTTALQFLLRKDQLEMHVRMRSNDVWWGTAYDLFMFSQLQCTLSNLLDVPPGLYVHQPVSLHLYDRDHKAVAKLRGHDGLTRFAPSGLGSVDMEWWQTRNRARQIWQGRFPTNTTLSEDWYCSKLLRPEYLGGSDEA